jgi:hypothetical protein
MSTVTGEKSVEENIILSECGMKETVERTLAKLTKLKQVCFIM